MNYQKLFAQRIGGESFGKDTTIYKFEKIKRDRKAFETANPKTEVINVGVGEHDGLAPKEVRGALSMEVNSLKNRGYADNGILEFQQAAAKYLNGLIGTQFPEDKDAAKFIMHGIGSKDILSILPSVFINPVDITLMTTPGYPVLGTHTRYLGGKVINLPLMEANNFLPDLGGLEEKIEEIEFQECGKVKMFCVNYPNNPTGADANSEFWQNLADIANERGFMVIHDAAYSGLNFKGNKPTGILQAKGGLECGIGIHSMSKAFNMISYRLAFAAANPEIIAAYGNVKDNSNSGQSPFIQRAGAFALEHPEFTDKIRRKYERRLSALAEVLNRNGFHAHVPDGTFFLYARAPTGTKDGKIFTSAEKTSQYMLTQQGISTVPWDDVGAYIRFSATFDAGMGHELLEGDPIADNKVFEKLDDRLGKLNLTFD